MKIIPNACTVKKVKNNRKCNVCVCCDTMLGIRCVGVGVGANQRIPLSVLVRNPYKRLAREISHETGRRRGKEGPRVKRRSQSAERGRTEKWTEQTNRQKSGEADGQERRLLKPVDSDAGLVNVRGWVSIPGDLVWVSLEYTLAIAHRMLRKCHKLLSSCAWS